MRAFLVDATIRTITEFDFVDKYHEPEEIIGGDGRGSFALGSGPLNPPREDDEDEYLSDYLYVRENLYPDEIARGVKDTPVIDGAIEIKGDPRFWFQIDADLDPPATLPIPGRGLVIGVNQDGEWTDARTTLEELTKRVRFTRRRLHGTISTEIIEGDDMDRACGSGHRGTLIGGDFRPATTQCPVFRPRARKWSLVWIGVVSTRSFASTEQLDEWWPRLARNVAWFGSIAKQASAVQRGRSCLQAVHSSRSFLQNWGIGLT